MHHSRTQHEIFNQWKAEQAIRGKPDGLSWKDYWTAQWKHEIEQALFRGWHLMKTVHLDKNPLAGSHGTHDKPLKEREALSAIGEGLNLGLVLHDLTVCDFDSPVLPDSLAIISQQTRTARTPKGYHFYLNGTYDKDLSRQLREKYPEIDTCRSGDNFALLPISQAYVTLKGIRQPGPPRVYEWICQKQMMTLQDFAKRLL